MNLPPVLRQRYFDINGLPLVGGKLHTYQAGTTTPEATYTDDSGVTPNANPIILDANGEASMWLDPTLSYKFVLNDSNDVLQWSVDNVVGTLTPDSVGTTQLQDGSVTSAKIAAGAVTSDKLTTQILGPYSIQNMGLSASVGSNELVITLTDAGGSAPSSVSPVKIPFRNATSATGTPVFRDVTSAITATLGAGATLASSNGKPNYIYVYALDNGGSVELAFSASKMWDEGSVQTTIAEGGLGTATSKTVLYANNARSVKAIRLLGRITSTQATAGQWVTSPSEISLVPLEVGNHSEVSLYNASGHGSTNTKIRTFGSVIVSAGPDITYATSPTDGDSFTINKDGLYGIQYSDGAAAVTSLTGVSVNAAGSDLTTSIGALSPPVFVRYCSNAGGFSSFTSVTRWFYAGDVIRPHTNGLNDLSGVNTTFTIARIL